MTTLTSKVSIWNKDGSEIKNHGDMRTYFIGYSNHTAQIEVHGSRDLAQQILDNLNLNILEFIPDQKSEGW